MARQRRGSRQTGQQQTGAQPVDPLDPTRLEAVSRAMAVASSETERLERLQRLLGRSLLDTSLSADQLGKAAAAAAKQQEGMERAARGATLAYAAFSGGLLAWTRAGLSGTTAGERLAFQHQQISQQIASIFLPVIQRYTDALGKVVDWFRALSGEQQGTIARWALFTAGVLGSALVIPRLTNAVGGLSAAFKGIFLVNPFAGLAAAIIGLQAQTEEGRESLASLGTAINEAFKGLAGLLSGPVAAGLEGIAKFISGAPGQWLAWGTVAVSVLYRIAAAGQGAATAFLGWGTALGAALLVVGGIITALGKAKDEARETVEAIAAGVRTGQTTEEEARERVRIEAERRGLEREEAARRGDTGGLDPRDVAGAGRRAVENLDPERAGREERDRIIRQGEEAIKRARQGRQDVLPVRTGAEDPRATIRRLEAATLRTGRDPNEETAEQTRKTAEAAAALYRLLVDFLHKLGVPDPTKAPNAD